MRAYLKITSLLLLLLIITVTGCDEELGPIEPGATGLIANAGPDQTVLINEFLELDGRASSSEDGKPFSYLWSVTSKPGGSVAEFDDIQVSRPLFTASMAGDYVIRLRINQGQRSAQDELTIHVDGGPTPTPVVLSTPILKDTTLANIITDPAVVDYIVTTDIEVRANLVIEPGVIIAFEQDKGLQVISGSLYAIGTETEGIYFKGTQADPAWWKGLLLYANSERNTLEYCMIQGGGSSAYGDVGVPANIALAGNAYSGAALRLTHSTITASGGYGLYVQGLSQIGTVADNIFSHHARAAAYIPAQQLHKLDGTNALSYNEFNGVETGGVVQGADVTWRRTITGPYRVTSNLEISAGVNIEPGVALVMDENVSVIVSGVGRISANGTAQNKILFSSSDPTKYWNGIAFNSSSLFNQLDHCIISNAGGNTIAGAAQKGNIVVSADTYVTVTNSTIRNGNGYGVVLKNFGNLNVDLMTANTFENLAQGPTYPSQAPIEKPTLTGTWVDQWTLNHGKNTIDENLYDRENGEWFGGGADPYSAPNAGYGLKITHEGKFVWTNVEYFGVFECPSHTAEFMTGNTAVLPNNTVTFNLNYWRSMFKSSCDATQNVDTEVETSPVTLRYEINAMYNVITGERYWELKFYNPDNSTFSLYRK